MKVKYLGHASFLITSNTGIRLITDPYAPGAYNGAVKYGRIEEDADIVIVSHDHEDHNGITYLRGSPSVVKGEGLHEVRGISFEGISSYHDPNQGKERGTNTIFSFEIDGIKLVHMGDIGEVISEDVNKKLEDTDLLLIPVGGFFTVSPDEAWKIVEMINPRLVIPMHFKTDKVGFPIQPVEDFIEGRPNVKILNTSETEVTLPDGREIWVLRPAL